MKDRFTVFLLLTLSLILVAVPTFALLKPGIFTMHDSHIFRLYEFIRCVSDLQIPCRWIPDGGFGYGQPLFIFYTQLPYLLGLPFLWIGLSFLTTLKLLFVLSLFLSTVSMFFLAKNLWKNNLGALIVSLLYSYAPYRAVDIYVRGALPESLAFTFFPLIFLSVNLLVDKPTLKKTISLGLVLSGLLLTHNLSFLMVLIPLVPWLIYKLFKTNNRKKVLFFMLLSLVITSFLSSSYLLPVIFENKYISLSKTTEGYYQYQDHFLFLRQIFADNKWGYGPSVKGVDDGLNLSIGYLQWIIPLVIFVYFLLCRRKPLKAEYVQFTILFFSSVLTVFFMHEWSGFVWKFIPVFHFIQFPWRLLGVTVFTLTLASGLLMPIITQKLRWLFTIIIIVGLILLNINYFKAGEWLYITDQEQFSGGRWEDLMRFGDYDYWYIGAVEYPKTKASSRPVFISGAGDGLGQKRTSNMSLFDLEVLSEQAEVEFPIMYFPGWSATLDHETAQEVHPSDKYGLIKLNIPKGVHQVSFLFSNTPIRNIGNTISLVTLFICLVGLLRKKQVL